MTIEEAQKILENFTGLDPKSTGSRSEKTEVRQALLLLTSLSDYQMLGVCASELAEGLSALETYLKALGYETPLDRATAAPVSGPVYIKFNGLRGAYYAEAYTGTYRGVLVSCQSAQEGGINDIYGHLPLDLFRG